MKRSLAALSLAAAAACTAARVEAAPPGGTQPDAVALEYRVKAAYLFNFTKFVEWPGLNDTAPLTICVAGTNPFGTTLADTVRDEQVNGRTLQTRVVRGADGCHVLFIPEGVPHEPYLRSAAKGGVLTVGETPGFIRDGGIVSFLLEEGKVRFEINQDVAERARLVISSRLLRLARRTVPGSGQGELRAR